LVVDDSAWMKRYKVQEDWRDLNGYFVHLARTGSAVNIATFVGATQIRLAVVGKQDRHATPEELAHMVALVDTAMEQGALGVSTALKALMLPLISFTARAQLCSPKPWPFLRVANP